MTMIENLVTGVLGLWSGLGLLCDAGLDAEQPG